MWRKAMVYLGLGDDAEYEEYASDDDEHRRGPARDRAAHVQPPRHQPAAPSPVTTYLDEPSSVSAVRPISASGGEPREPVAATGHTVNPTGGTVSRPRPQVVRPLAATTTAKPHLVAPESFNEAQAVADKYKGNQPVVMNLQGADRELARRLIDFASGLCYGLGGQMERVANQVYLLTPTNVEVSAEERRRLHERGYDA